VNSEEGVGAASLRTAKYQPVRPLGGSVRTNGVQRSIAVFFSPFVKFVEFVAIKIKNGSMSVCGQTSGHVTLTP